MMRFNPYIFLFLLLNLNPISQASAPKAQWDTVSRPSQQAPQSIGTYTGGCLSGAASLPTEGVGYQVMRLSRQRRYGHPHLIEFVEQLGKLTASEQHSSLLIGDLGQMRGGPTPSGHRSHQTGLDVDIWFLLLQPATHPPLSHDERETWQAPSMLNKGVVDNALWTQTHEKILATAASLPFVERIFVNARIKQALCQHAPAHNRAWLRKIRPWWQHDDHFHVRLSCPEGDAHCQHQAPLPAGEGCGGELAWWFGKDSTKPSTPQKAGKSAAHLPALCKQVLQSQ